MEEVITFLRGIFGQYSDYMVPITIIIASLVSLLLIFGALGGFAYGKEFNETRSKSISIGSVSQG